VTPTHDEAGDPTAHVDGLSLSEYVEVCRALIRNGGDSAHRIEEVLAAYGLTQHRWVLARTAWTERIRRNEDVRSEFQRLYARPADDPVPGNE
jgi:hypothetical protein